MEQEGLTGQQVAKELRISKTEIYRRLKLLGLDPPGRGGFTVDLVAQLHAAPALATGSPRSTPPNPSSESPGSAGNGSQRMSLAAVARTLDVDSAAVNRWLREEPELRSRFTREGRRVWLEPDSLPLLRTIQERRAAAAPESLRRAWAARRAKAREAQQPADGATASSDAKAKRAKAPSRAPARRAMTGAQAARSLGMRRPTLYTLMRRHGVQPPGRSEGFTPDRVEQLRALFFPTAVGSVAPAPQTASAPATSAPAAARTSSADLSSAEPVLRLVATVERMAADFSAAVVDFSATMRKMLEHEGELLAQQRMLIERLRPVALKLTMDEEPKPPSRPGAGAPRGRPRT